MGKLSPISQEAIFRHLPRDTRGELKARIPGLRSFSAPEDYGRVSFLCRPDSSEIEIPSVCIIFMDEVDGKTRVTRYLKSQMKIDDIDLSIPKLTEIFFSKMLNQRNVTIKTLVFQGKVDPTQNVEKIIAKVRILEYHLDIEYKPGHIRKFRDVQELSVCSAKEFPESCMDDLLAMNIQKLKISTEKFPNDEYLKLTTKTLNIHSSECTLDDFVQRMKKIASGAHSHSSECSTLHFTDNEEIPLEELYNKITSELGAMSVRCIRRDSDTIVFEVSGKADLQLNIRALYNNWGMFHVRGDISDRRR